MLSSTCMAVPAGHAFNISGVAHMIVLFDVECLRGNGNVIQHYIILILSDSVL